MDAVCIKMDKRLSKNMDTVMKEHNYSTKTEFIREAIRDKLTELEKEKMITHLKKLVGASKKKTTEDEYERVREEVMKELGKSFGLE